MAGASSFSIFPIYTPSDPLTHVISQKPQIMILVTARTPARCGYTPQKTTRIPQNKMLGSDTISFADLPRCVYFFRGPFSLPTPEEDTVGWCLIMRDDGWWWLMIIDDDWRWLMMVDNAWWWLMMLDHQRIILIMLDDEGRYKISEASGFVPFLQHIWNDHLEW